MIRKLSISDLDNIFTIGQDIYTWVFERISWNRGLIEWYYENFPELCFVYEEKGRIIGFILGMIANDIGYIGWVAVKEEDRRRGVGDLLLTTLLDKFQEKKLTLLAAHVRDETAPTRLFNKFGFKSTSERKIEMVLDPNAKKKYYDNPFAERLMDP